MSANNFSVQYCKELAKANGWKKDSRRNVVEIDGERWSFSVSQKRNGFVECRQCYEDTVGFITYIPETSQLMSYRVGKGKYQERFCVSRIASSGLKAYNVSPHTVEMVHLPAQLVPNQ